MFGRIARRLVRGTLYAVLTLVVLGGLGLASLETAWGKNQVRRMIVSQANRYLTATLDIDRIEGSFFGGIVLAGVRLSRDGRPIVTIDRASLVYSPGELFDQGTTIRSVRLERLRVALERESDGRWNVAALVRREGSPQQRSGPRRPIHLPSVEIVDGIIEMRDSLTFGAAHVPTRFDALNTALAFALDPDSWRLNFARMAWRGTAPDLTVTTIAGGLSNSNDGLTFNQFSVVTPQSAFTLDGRIARGQGPSILDLRVNATRFVFQEWTGILTGLQNIVVDSAFTARLAGPLQALRTELTLRSNGGNVGGPFVLDTTVPGWHGKGSVELERFDLARWLNRADRPSDISGRVDFDLDLNLGHVPRGTYSFAGSHAAYLGYEGDGIKVRGTVRSTEVLIRGGSATAYGARVDLSTGSIALAEPYPFRFQGAAGGVDLRRIPSSVPVPHVESTLTFAYDVNGQFSKPFIRGDARFDPSEFLGAAVGAGTVGSIDTSVTPIHYAGEGDISGLDMQRFGSGLHVDWMQQPRYAGTLAGRFHVDGTGTDPRTMTLTGGGRLVRGDFFGGTLSNADVAVDIADGTLRASYDGALDHVDPALAIDDARYTATLTGSGRGRFRVQDLLVRSPTSDDYVIDADLFVDDSRVRGVPIERGTTKATLSGTTLTISDLRITGPELVARGSGILEFDGQKSSRFDYVIEHAELPALEELLGRHVPGDLLTSGQMTGPIDRLRFVGSGTVNHLATSGVSAATATAKYDITTPTDDPIRATARIEGQASSVQVLDTELEHVEGTVSYDSERLNVELQLARTDGLTGGITAGALLHSNNRSLDLSSATLTFLSSTWQLAGAPPTLRWDDSGLAVTSATFAASSDPSQRVSIAGTWRDDGSGLLQIKATRVLLDALLRERSAVYGGVIDLDATLRGTRDRPLLSAEVSIADGRVRRVSYQKLAGHIEYADEAAHVDLRLDQAPGVFLTAVGRVPLQTFQHDRADQPIDLAINSSSISLGLIEGVTTTVRNVSGNARLNLMVAGTGLHPEVTGTADLADAAFSVVSSGSRYRNGRALVQFAADRVAVQQFHLEDSRGRALEVSGSLGTRGGRVGDLAVDVTSKGFEVLRNEFGTMDVDARLSLRGQFDSPRIEGRLTVVGGAIRVDEILDRTLFRPYATAPTEASAVDAVAALNPWERLGMNIELHVPGTLRMTGREVQVTSNTPIGLGSINLRPVGDLYLYKDPAQPLYVTGSFDSITGTYSFQGRRFDLDPTSSINFRGDLNPELFVTVSRLITGVETRVTIAGPLREPELRLASSPPLDPSDILSLIVFNASANQLSADQQRSLAIRAGALAAGFLATPLLNAVERSLGLEILEVEAPQAPGGGPRVTIGDELAPGLVARFSRQFGPNEYNEAAIEYQLSRILSIRATFSDVQDLNQRTSFRRVERAGIDLIVFFSF